MIEKTKTVSVSDFGALGDGLTDDTAAIQAALDSGAERVRIPFGNYRVTETLLVHSNTEILADRCARVVLAGDRKRQRGDFLLSNADTVDGNENISIVGGIWDGNNQHPQNAKPDIFDNVGYSGAVLNFVNLNGLNLRDITVANSTTYYVRMARLENFDIENVDLVSDEFGKNQDGLHFGGAVRHGRVKNLRALSDGQTNDDMVALNADDSVERVENLDLVRDDIENISFENIFATNCYTVIRMLSVDAAIRNIRFKNVYAGYRNFVINGDGARYCKTPLFREEDRPDGIGRIENIEIDGLVCYPVTEPHKRNPEGQVGSEFALRLECYCDNFTVKNFKKLKTPNDDGTHALMLSHVKGVEAVANGKSYKLDSTSDELILDNFENLTINKT